MKEQSLINLSPPDRRLDRELLDAPGGFLWWYVDLVDEMGDGLVLIWSYGLPFLPGYASSARRGRAQRPSERPSLNLSIYKGGQLDFYLLQEYAADEVSWSQAGSVTSKGVTSKGVTREEVTSEEATRREDAWHFGQSHIKTSVEDGRLRLTAELDCSVQGAHDRLTGHIEVEGVCRKPNGCEIDSACHHDWTPRLGPATGRAELIHAEHRWHLTGRAYHDRNGGSLPLHDLGIDYWLWGRVPQADRELIYYLLWADGAATPVCKGLSIDADGTTEVYDDLEIELGVQRKNIGGLVWWESISVLRPDPNGAPKPWLRVKHTDVVDSGPFYMRYMTQVDDASSTTKGIGELVKPDRIDLDRHRALVRMRVHHLGGVNSMWLPLFTGPKTGRVRRLLVSWVPGSWVPGSWLDGGGR